MRPIALIAAFAALALPTLGELAISSPVSSTTCSGGQSCNVAWTDNGKAPTLAQQANCTFALYTGSKSQQTFLQPIAFPNSIDVSKTSSIDFTVDPTIGENGSNYFIRVSSLAFKDGANPYLSFSSMFTLNRMTGTFNQTVKNQIQNVTTTTTAPTTTATTTGATTRSSSSSSSSRAANTAAVSSNNSTGAAFVNASPTTYTGVAAFIGAVLGLVL